MPPSHFAAFVGLFCRSFFALHMNFCAILTFHLTFGAFFLLFFCCLMLTMLEIALELVESMPICTQHNIIIIIMKRQAQTRCENTIYIKQKLVRNSQNLCSHCVAFNWILNRDDEETKSK